MSDESEINRVYQGESSGRIIGLIVLALIAWWIYTNVLVDNKKPWWNGVAYLRVCEVHNPNSTGCSSLPVTVQNNRIISLGLPDGKSAFISTNDCDKSDFDGGLAGKGKRFCVIGEFSGNREWQVSEN